MFAPTEAERGRSSTMSVPSRQPDRSARGEAAPEPAPPRRATARAILGTALRAWARNLVPLTLVALAVELPLTLVELARRKSFAIATLGDTLAQSAAWLLAVTVMTAASLRAARGERVRLVEALAAVRAAPRVLAAHLAAYGVVIAGATSLRLYGRYPSVIVPYSDDLLAGGIIAVVLACVVLRTLVFPLTAVTLEEPGLGPAAAARRARALTAGRRLAVFLVLLVPLAAFTGNFFGTVSKVLDPAPSPEWIVGRRLVVAFASSFLELLPAAAYVLLRREKEGSLAEVFE